MAKPIIFRDFTQNLNIILQSEPSETEMTDIIYYYSFYAIIYLGTDLDKYSKTIEYLNIAINEMENDFDEPRLSQLLIRRLMLMSRMIGNEAIEDDFSKGILQTIHEDARRARDIAINYNEPHLLASSALGLSILARKKKDFENAFKFVREAEYNYSELMRIPQYIESVIEYLKVVLLGLETNAFDFQTLFDIVRDIQKNAEDYIVERIKVYEPEYCYLMGLIYSYSNAARKDVLVWFADSISLAEQYEQLANFQYFKGTCRQLNILGEVE